MLFGKKQSRTVSALEAILAEREATIRSLEHQNKLLLDLVERQSYKLERLESVVTGEPLAAEDGD